MPQRCPRPCRRLCPSLVGGLWQPGLKVELKDLLQSQILLKYVKALRWNQFKVALGDLGNAIISWYLLLESYILVIGKVTIVLLQNHDQIINKDNNSKLKTCSQVLLAFLFFSFDFSCSFKPFNVVGQCGNCLKLFDLAQRVTQYWWYPQKTLGF